MGQIGNTECGGGLNNFFLFVSVALRLLYQNDKYVWIVM